MLHTTAVTFQSNFCLENNEKSVPSLNMTLTWPVVMTIHASGERDTCM